jgi:hypothetical protein
MLRLTGDQVECLWDEALPVHSYAGDRALLAAFGGRKSRREANRCLKRYLARSLYRLLEHAPMTT